MTQFAKNNMDSSMLSACLVCLSEKGHNYN